MKTDISAPVNFYDSWSHKVFVQNKCTNAKTGETLYYRPLDHEPVTADSNKRVHLVIFGMSDMGISLAVQAAHICHFPNFVTKGIKTRITFIDKDADNKIISLKTRLHNFLENIDYFYTCLNQQIQTNKNPKENKFTDIELEFIKANLGDSQVNECLLKEYLLKSVNEKTNCLTVAIATPDSASSLAFALNLPEEIFDYGASVLVRQDNLHDIATMLSKEKGADIYNKYKNMRPFGMVNDFSDMEEADFLIPMMIKYVYDNTKFNKEHIIKDFDIEKIKENWNNWDPEQNVSALKAANRYAADFIYTKQRSLNIKEGIDLDEDQSKLAAKMEHNRWLTEKLLTGFRAPTKQESALITKENREYYKSLFIHPDIRPYEELEEDAENLNVKIYDINISNSLPYMLKAFRFYKSSGGKP